MIFTRVFARLPDDIVFGDNEAFMEAWQERMDQLLLSDPRDVLSFVTDCLISLAARVNEDEDDPWESVLRLVEDASAITNDDSDFGRDEVIELTKNRMKELLSHIGEQTDLPIGQVLGGIYRFSREAPWPEDRAGWMYLSFASEEKWLGAAVVRGGSVAAACANAVAVGINPVEIEPETQVFVAGTDFTAAVEGGFPEEMLNRLLSEDEIVAAGFEVGPMMGDPLDDKDSADLFTAIESFLAEQGGEDG